MVLWSATAVAGSKVIIFLWINSLQNLLYEIQPSVAIIEKYGEVSSKNEAFTNAVIHNNPLKTVEDIRVTSSKMASLEKEGKIKIVGAIYKMAA